MRVLVDRFDSAEHIKGRARTYEAVKAAVLEAGRFSVFEATSSALNAGIFTKLSRDPELVVVPEQYPWTKVTRRDSK